jgi:hypothetical protein
MHSLEKKPFNLDTASYIVKSSRGIPWILRPQPTVTDYAALFYSYVNRLCKAAYESISQSGYLINPNDNVHHILCYIAKIIDRKDLDYNLDLILSSDNYDRNALPSLMFHCSNSGLYQCLGGVNQDLFYEADSESLGDYYSSKVYQVMVANYIQSCPMPDYFPDEKELNLSDDDTLSVSEPGSDDESVFELDEEKHVNKESRLSLFIRDSDASSTENESHKLFVKNENGVDIGFDNLPDLEQYLADNNIVDLPVITSNPFILVGGMRKKKGNRKRKKGGRRKGGPLISMKGDQRAIIVPNPTISTYFRKSVNVVTDAAGRFSIYGSLRSVIQAYNNANPFDRAPQYALLYDTYKPLSIKLYMTLQAPIIAATGRIGTSVDFDHTPPSSFVLDDLVASANYREHLGRGVIDIIFPLGRRTLTEGEYTPNGADPSIAIIHKGGYLDFATPVTTGTWFLAGDNLPPTSIVGTLIITMKSKCRDSRLISAAVAKRLAKDPNQQLPEQHGLSLPVDPLHPEDDIVLQEALEKLNIVETSGGLTPANNVNVTIQSATNQPAQSTSTQSLKVQPKLLSRVR